MKTNVMSYLVNVRIRESITYPSTFIVAACGPPTSYIITITVTD